MTLVLSPQLEASLIQAARLNGLSPDAYAELLLRRALPELSDPQPDSLEPRRAGGAKGLVTIPPDFDGSLEDFAEYM